MFPETRNKVILLIIVIPICILSMLYLYLLRPVQSQVDSLTEKVTNEKKVISSLEEQLQQNSSSNGNNLSSVVLPNTPEVHQLVLLFREAETASGTNIVTISTIDSTPANGSIEGVNPITMLLSISSPTYASYKDFLNTIDGSGRILQINGISMNANNGFNATNGSLQAEITVTSYYQAMN